MASFRPSYAANAEYEYKDEGIIEGECDIVKYFDSIYIAYFQKVSSILWHSSIQLVPYTIARTQIFLGFGPRLTIHWPGIPSSRFADNQNYILALYVYECRNIRFRVRIRGLN
jgi:hypothetical protein